MPVTYQYQSGIGAVAAYQVSGVPYVTGSDVDTNLANNGQVFIEFPRVAKSFTIINKTLDSSSIIVHFQDRGTNPLTITNRHFITIPSVNDGFTFNVRVKEMYVSMSGSVGTGSFELWAELTSIDRTNMYTLTGSGIDE